MNFSIQAWFRLFRPQNAVIAGAGVWLGWVSMHPLRPDLVVALWGSLSMALLTMGGNADNDVCDVAVDRINRPDRPLAAGLLKVSQVRVASFFLYALSFAAALGVTPVHGMLVLGMILLLRAYNLRLKGFPIAGNLAVSLLCGLAIYFPEFPFPIRNTLPAVVFAFLATFAREVVKDIEDVKGDRTAMLHTFPIITKVDTARKLAFSLLGILLALLPMPSIYFHYRWPYAVLSLALAGPFLLMLLWELSKSSADFNRCQRNLKWMMLGGMIALLAGVL